MEMTFEVSNSQINEVYECLTDKQHSSTIVPPTTASKPVKDDKVEAELGDDKDQDS